MVNSSISPLNYYSPYDQSFAKEEEKTHKWRKSTKNDKRKSLKNKNKRHTHNKMAKQSRKKNR